MIVDGLLFILSNLLRFLLLPLEAINIGIDFVSSIPYVMQFFQIVAYIIPWTNFIPLFILVISIISFKIVISLLKTLWQVLPFV